MRKKHFKLYADECIEQDFIDHLRKKHNLDVRSVREEGYQGKPDEFILKRANETRRFLLTYNKHFFTNDRLFPFKGLFGIICLKFRKTDTPCGHILWLPVHAKQSLVRKKFLVSNDNVSIRYIGENGKTLKEKLDVKDCLLCKLDDAM